MLRSSFGVILRTSVSSVFLLMIASSLFAAGSFHPMGGRAGGVGDAFVAGGGGIEGVWANPAAVVERGVEGWVSAQRPFGLVELERRAGSARIGGQWVGVALSQETYGSDLYREAVTALTGGSRVTPWLRVGARVRRVSARADGWPERSWWVFDVGFMGGVDSRFVLGAAAWNAGGHRTALLGQGGQGGFRARAADDIWIYGQVEKMAGRPTGGGVGLEWRAAGGIWLRAGAGGHPERMAVGVGVARTWFRLDYAAQFHARLGVTHRFSVTLGTAGSPPPKSGAT